jgi:hypothetical protein
LTGPGFGRPAERAAKLDHADDLDRCPMIFKLAKAAELTGIVSTVATSCQKSSSV